MDAGIYNPNKNKLDAKIFIGYLEKSKGHKFYCPNYSTRIFGIGSTKFIKSGDISGSI